MNQRNLNRVDKKKLKIRVLELELRVKRLEDEKRLLHARARYWENATNELRRLMQ